MKNSVIAILALVAGFSEEVQACTNFSGLYEVPADVNSISMVTEDGTISLQPGYTVLLEQNNCQSIHLSVLNHSGHRLTTAQMNLLKMKRVEEVQGHGYQMRSVNSEFSCLLPFPFLRECARTREEVSFRMILQESGRIEMTYDQVISDRKTLFEKYVKISELYSHATLEKLK